MCLFKKRKKEEPVTGNKYFVGDFILFHRKNELYNGYIYKVHYDNEKNIVYDIQIGGECPVVIENILENKIVRRAK